jgi:hypothetical protein
LGCLPHMPRVSISICTFCTDKTSKLAKLRNDEELNKLLVGGVVQQKPAAYAHAVLAATGVNVRRRRSVASHFDRAGP